LPNRSQTRITATASPPPSNEAWLAARRIAHELDRILDEAGLHRAAVDRAAAELRLSTRHVYRLLASIASSGECRRCCRARTARGRSGFTMTSRESSPETLRAQWLTLEAPPLAPVVAEIRARCEEAGLAAPSYVAIDRRIRSLFSSEEIAKKRSANPKHLLRLKPRPGYIRASKPLEVCQIDHTPTDINFVEVVEGEGVFVGRAYLTLVADVATRSILGFCLTLEKPSALSVALCLAQTMCPKEDWLARAASSIAGRCSDDRGCSSPTPRKSSKGALSSAAARTTAFATAIAAASMRAEWSNGSLGSSMPYSRCTRGRRVDP
jgi:putative transposase